MVFEAEVNDYLEMTRAIRHLERAPVATPGMSHYLKLRFPENGDPCSHGLPLEDILSFFRGVAEEHLGKDFFTQMELSLGSSVDLLDLSALIYTGDFLGLLAFASVDIECARRIAEFFHLKPPSIPQELSLDSVCEFVNLLVGNSANYLTEICTNTKVRPEIHSLPLGFVSTGKGVNVCDKQMVWMQLEGAKGKMILALAN